MNHSWLDVARAVLCEAGHARHDYNGTPRAGRKAPYRCEQGEHASRSLHTKGCFHAGDRKNHLCLHRSSLSLCHYPSTTAESAEASGELTSETNFSQPRGGGEIMDKFQITRFLRFASQITRRFSDHPASASFCLADHPTRRNVVSRLPNTAKCRFQVTRLTKFLFPDHPVLSFASQITRRFPDHPA